MNWFRRKPLDQLIPEENESHFVRALSAPQLIVFGIGVIIGAGLFSITGIAAAENAGPAILISFLIAGLGSCFAGLCYSELAAMIPLSGSAYTYAYATFGELIAWILGWDLILEYAVGAATVSISWSAYFISLLEDFGISFPKYLASSPWQHHEEGLINLPALVITTLLTFLIIFGIKQAARFNSFMVALKVIIIISFILLGFPYINYNNFVPFIPDNTGVFGEFGWSGIFKGAGVIFFAYIGFDAVSTVAQETKNPRRDLPIGIMGSLGVSTLLYILFAFVLTGLVNYKELATAAPVALAIDHTPYTWLKYCIKIAILAGFSSVILVLLVGQSRIFYTMAKDGLIPNELSKLHPKFKTPWLINWLLLILTGTFGAFLPISVVGHMTSIGTLFAFIVVTLGVCVLRYEFPKIRRPFKTPFLPFVAFMSLLTCGLMMLSLGASNWIRLIVWLIIGLFIYVFYGYKHSILNKNE